MSDQPHLLRTICRDCVFSVWDDNQQVGCYLNRLDKFEKNGAIVEEMLEETEDRGIGYYAINGRFCNACRNLDWADSHQLESIDAMRDKVRRDMRPQCDMVVYTESLYPNEQVYSTLQAFAGQEIEPSRMIVALSDPEANSYDFVKMVRLLNPPCPWEVRTPAASMTYDEVIDETVRNCGGSHYAVFKAGALPPPDWLTTIDRAINEHMLQLVAVLPDKDGNGLFMQKGLHKLIQGNRGETVIDKVVMIAQEEGNQHMIKSWEDLKCM